ncbi:MAG: tetratricopeptide repeat protein [Bacteroidetes bacterium]|nr:tetratricopeptide repeat protein [Bacteroidota bacterium]MBX7044946.1 tetratricopeptide repeat protein [Ignavibacteria bacterium]
MKQEYFIFLSALFFLFANFSYPQTSIDADFRKKANEYFINSDWDNAIEMYSKIVSVEDKNMNAWARLSSCYINKKDYEKAFETLQQGSSKGDNPFIWYNLSCLYARKNIKEKSLEALRKAINSGYAASENTLNDEDFKQMKNDKDFLAIIDEMKRAEFPCRYNERLNEFEFWVGEWNVYTTLGNKAGESKIEKILNDCVILENWTNAGGRKGKSFNMINSNTGDWEQTWVDDSGNTTEFKKGKLEGNALSLMAEIKDAENKKQYYRMTFFKNPDGTVRQLGETSYDNKEWQVSYDLLYKRKN